MNKGNQMKRLVLASTMLAGIAVGAAPAFAQECDITVGVVMELTGPAGEYGKAGAKSVEMAFRDFNDAGGVGGCRIILPMEMGLRLISRLPLAMSGTRLPTPDFLRPDRLDCASVCTSHVACRGNCQPSWARDRRAACRAALVPLGPWGQ